MLNSLIGGRLTRIESERPGSQVPTRPLRHAVTMQNKLPTTTTIAISKINRAAGKNAMDRREQGTCFLQQMMRSLDNFTMATSLYKRRPQLQDRTDSRSRGWVYAEKECCIPRRHHPDPARRSCNTQSPPTECNIDTRSTKTNQTSTPSNVNYPKPLVELFPVPIVQYIIN